MYMTPWPSKPSACMPFNVASTSWWAAATWSSLNCGNGLIAPIPPVLGPRSLAKRRLWSWESGRMTRFSPLNKAMTEASSPARYCSSSTVASGESAYIFSIVSSSVSASWAIATPFPAAKPSFFKTSGKPIVAASAWASIALWTVLLPAVGNWWRAIKSLANVLLASNWATLLVAPKIGWSAAWKASTIPAANGTSGPTKVRSIWWVSAKSINLVKSLSSMLIGSTPSKVIAGLPGAT